MYMYDIRFYLLRNSARAGGRSNSPIASYLKKVFKGHDDYKYTIVNNLWDLYTGDVGIIFFADYLTEVAFHAMFSKFQEPYILMAQENTTGYSSALDCFSFLKHHVSTRAAEFISGTPEAAFAKIHFYCQTNREVKKNLVTDSVGVILNEDLDIPMMAQVPPISSIDKLNLNQIPISTKELISTYNKIKCDSLPTDVKKNLNWDFYEVLKAYRLYLAFKKLIEKYNLRGLTLNCSDFYPDLNATACLAFQLLHKDGYLTSCAQGVPSYICSRAISDIYHEESAQMQIAGINVDNGELTLCANFMPKAFLENPVMDTTADVSVGLTLKGSIKKGLITLCKVSSHLTDYYVNTGEIVRDIKADGLQRNACIVRLDNVEQLRDVPLGGHFVICYGDRARKLREFFTERGMVPYSFVDSYRNHHLYINHSLFKNIQGALPGNSGYQIMILNSRENDNYVLHDIASGNTACYKINRIVHFESIKAALDHYSSEQLTLHLPEEEFINDFLRPFISEEREKFEGVHVCEYETFTI